DRDRRFRPAFPRGLAPEHRAAPAGQRRGGRRGGGVPGLGAGALDHRPDPDGGWRLRPLAEISPYVWMPVLPYDGAVSCYSPGAAVMLRSCAVLALTLLLSGCDAVVDNIA